MCWEDCECKNSHPLTPPEAATTIAGLLKVARGECQGCPQPISIRPSPPTNPQALLGLTSRGKYIQRSGVEAKGQLIGKYNLPETRVANSCVDLDPQPNNTMNSSASTSSRELSPTLYFNQGTTEVVPIPDMASHASITGPYLRSPTPPSPVMPTPDPPILAHLAPAPPPSPAPVPNSVTFGPRIAEALPYATTAQAP